MGSLAIKTKAKRENNNLAAENIQTQKKDDLNDEIKKSGREKRSTCAMENEQA